MRISNKKIKKYYDNSDIEGLREYLLSKGMTEKKVLNYIMAMYVDNIPTKYFYQKNPIVRKKATTYFLVLALLIFISLYLFGVLNDTQLSFGLCSTLFLIFIQKKFKKHYI